MDRWINGRTASEINPAVAAMVPTSRRNSRRVVDAIFENTWVSDITGNLSQEGCLQCVSLWL
jgi:hypothetical protein